MNLTTKQASERLGVHRNTIYRMRLDGRLKSARSTAVRRGRVYVTEASVKALEKKRDTETGRTGKRTKR